MEINFWLLFPSLYLLGLGMLCIAFRSPEREDSPGSENQILCLYCNRVMDKDKLCGSVAYPRA